MSCTHWALGSVREQPTCMVTGQAAGVAAALAATSDSPLRDLDIATLQQVLMDQGVDLGPAFDQEFPPMPWIPRATGPKFGQPLPRETQPQLIAR
jgi:hypothetical protein